MTFSTRRRAHARLLALACGLAASLTGLPLAAQTFPDHTVKLVTPFPAGGSTDGVARPLAGELQKLLGQNVIVENRGGAGGSIGTAMVARGPADGHTALIVFDTHAINPLIYKSLDFDTFKDLKAVGQIVSMPLVLVAHPSLPANNLKELVTLSKAKPGSVSYASAGAGSSNQLAAELFSRTAGIRMNHIPYKGGGPAINDLLAGHVQSIFVSQPLVLKFIESGRLKALAVMGNERSKALPNVPSTKEQGYDGLDVSSWIGMVVPAGIPDAAMRRWTDALQKAVHAKDFQAHMKQAGFNVVESSPQKFDAHIRREYERWDPIVEDLGIVAD